MTFPKDREELKKFVLDRAIKTGLAMQQMPGYTAPAISQGDDNDLSWDEYPTNEEMDDYEATVSVAYWSGIEGGIL